MGSATWFILVLYFSLSHGQHPSWHPDFMSNEDKTTVKQLTLDLLRNIHIDNRQLLDVKQQHNSKISYQVGLVIGTVREKYKRCMDIYRELLFRIRGNTTLFGPGIWRFKPLHYAIGMETIRRLEIEIDKYIHVIMSIPESDLDEEAEASRKVRGPSVGRSRSIDRAEVNKPKSNLKMFTTAPNASVSEARKFLNEEDVKKHYREDYMKQAGLKGKDWSLDHYYGFT